MRSVPNLAAVQALDEAEIIEGYWDGYHGEPEPGDNRTLSYWHGWRNGAGDKGLRPQDDEQRRICHEYVSRTKNKATT